MTLGRSFDVSHRVLAGVLGAIALAGALVAVLADGSSPRANDADGGGAPVQLVSPMWIAPQTFKGMIDKTDAVVDGHVSAVEPGEPIKQPPVEGLPDGAIPDVPTQRIRFEVDDVIHGAAPESITLHQTGGKSTDGETDERVVADGDPEFQVGKRYVLFVQRRAEDGTYLYFGPFGRFGVDGNGRLQAVEHHHPGPAKLDGVPASEVGARIREERSPR